MKNITAQELLIKLDKHGIEPLRSYDGSKFIADIKDLVTTKEKLSKDPKNKSATRKKDYIDFCIECLGGISFNAVFDDKNEARIISTIEVKYILDSNEEKIKRFLLQILEKRDEGNNNSKLRHWMSFVLFYFYKKCENEQNDIDDRVRKIVNKYYESIIKDNKAFFESYSFSLEIFGDESKNFYKNFAKVKKEYEKKKSFVGFEVEKEESRKQLIGRFGELIFHEMLQKYESSNMPLLNSKGEEIELFINKGGFKGENFVMHENKWVFKEKRRSFDFTINNLKYDVKTSIREKDIFYVSRSENKNLLEGDLRIIKIDIVAQNNDDYDFKVLRVRLLELKDIKTDYNSEPTTIEYTFKALKS